ncbi:hypothetical protein HY612_03115 [Candidatus Roizmanbacteria bacterium]|nr:hypothetical protein [Candidatus Roizmanbacteria bacterium]
MQSEAEVRYGSELCGHVVENARGRWSFVYSDRWRDRGESASVWKIIFFPLAKFILNYFIKLGFLDGPAGFTYAFLMSFHSFLVRAKLWQYSKSINLRHSGER